MALPPQMALPPHEGLRMARIPETVTINAIVSQVKLAEVALWARDVGLPFTSRSELVRTILDLFHRQLERSGSLKAKVSLEESRDVLEALGMKFQGRNRIRLDEYVDTLPTIGGLDYVKAQDALLAEERREVVRMTPEMLLSLLGEAVEDEDEEHD